MICEVDTLSGWLNSQIEDRDWSLRETARRAGLSPSVVSDVLTEKIRASYDFCMGIAQALDVPPEDVLRRAGLLPKQQGYNPKAEELLGLFAHLGEMDQDELIALARLKLERLRKEQRGK